MRIILLFFAALFLASCSEKTDELVLDMGHEYFPLEIGRVRYYEADSVTFRPVPGGVQVDTTHLFIREVVADTFRDAGNELRYLLERYTRSDENGSWQLDKVLSASREDRQAVLTEDNLPYVKLIFPLKAGDTWEGNRMFAADELRLRVAGELIDVFKEWTSGVVDVDQSFTSGDLQFEDVAIIRHADFESVVDIRTVEEQYAKGVGLIYREMMIMDSQCQACCDGDTGYCQTLEWPEKAEAGFILREWMTGFE